jgi:hypothetical protein
LCQGLREEAAAVAGDLESALPQSIAPSVVIEELRINRKLGALSEAKLDFRRIPSKNAQFS